MKHFNIAKSNFKLNGIIMPVNACYGCFDGHWGKRLHVTTNGSRVNARITHDRINNNIYYMVDNFTPHTITGKDGLSHKHYYIHVYDIIRNRWYHNVDTNKPKYYALADYLTRLFAQNNITPRTKCIYGGVAGGLVPAEIGNAAAEKKPQIFDDALGVASVGYTLSTHTITSGYNGWSDYEHTTSCKIKGGFRL